jgi:hypothetical protein
MATARSSGVMTDTFSTETRYVLVLAKKVLHTHTHTHTCGGYGVGDGGSVFMYVT